MTEKQYQLDRERDSTCLSRPIVWYFMLTAICVFGSRSIFAFLPFSELTYDIIRYGGTLGFLLFSFPKIKRKYYIWFLGLELFFMLSYLISYLLGYMLTENVLPYCISTLVICIPFCITIASIDDYDVLYRKLLYVSFPIAGIVIYYSFFSVFSVEYSMSASYQLVLTGAIHFNEVFKSKRLKLIYLLLVGLQLVTIFIRGARGPLLCLIVFIAVKTLLYFRNNTKVLAVSFIGIFSLVIAVQNISTIMNWVGERLNAAGLYSRNYQYILSDALFSDSGRGNFYKRAIELIVKNPVFGYGASSDVMLLGGQYTHSLPLELMFDYGILIGGIIFMYLSIHVVHSFFIPDGTEQDLRMIFITQGYLMLFFSGTYLQSVNLFLFLGIAISSIYVPRIKKRKIVSN